ncbi:MAG TPA: flavodoxin [Allosphingosinicella sp.]|jgi:flavodoxin
MAINDHIDRRTILAGTGLLSLAMGTGVCAEPASPVPGPRSSTLVAYFTRSGNTRVIAGTLQRILAADLFEIRAARPYPEDYEQTVEQARQERDRGYEPPLQARVPNIRAYDTVFLGFPIWGETAPPVIRSFLKAHDLSGKRLRPFITHGGYGLGSSLAVLTSHAPNARIEEPFSMEADQERRTLDQIRSWLGRIGAR